MSIRIYNTLTGKKEEFKPIKKDSVGLYVCGVTVYDECHIGHVRGAFTFDIVRRYFEYRGYKVRYVRNITDVDDKIIEKARKEIQGSGINTQGINEKVKEVAERYTKSYYDDMKTLGVREADIEPKATDHIKDMIRLTKRLIQKGYAYEKDGDVYFEVRKFKEYGKLSRQSLDEMEVGARIGVDEKKKDPLDFALWKSSKENEPCWDSPWGKGRPGWHIECSAMSTKYLGESFDIHGGGRDLVFPHHENEISQSECATGKQFARYWMHNGLLTIDGAKMAKSLGNFISIKDLVRKFNPEALKIFFLSSHYRSPIDFTFERMEAAKKARERFYILFDKLKRVKGQGSRIKGKERCPEIEVFRKKFEDAMDDDFNTAEALAALFDLVTYVNKKLADDRVQSTELQYANETLLGLGKVLGLFGEGQGKGRPADVEISGEKIRDLIEQRARARQRKDFKTADRIREELSKVGVVIEDQKDGTTWRFK